MKPKIVFSHFHNGNDADHKIRGHATYATKATLLDLDSGIPIAQECAYCSPRDVPSRSLGRKISLGRLRKIITDMEWFEALANTPQLQKAIKKGLKHEQNPHI